MTMAQDGGKVVSRTHWPHLPSGNLPGTHFCYRLSRPQCHSGHDYVVVDDDDDDDDNNNNNSREQSPS
jgi:hypothetical protein